MSESAVTQATAAAEESPFHLRGYIGPQHTGAWKAMKWHEDILRAVFHDLDRDPPEYILARAPAQGGKTTFAMQFLDRTASDRPDILAVYVPLGATTKSQQDFLRQVHDAFVRRVGEWLDGMASRAISDRSLELSELLTSSAALEFDDLDGLLRGLLRLLPESLGRVVLVLDDSDSLDRELRLQLAEAFRTIHAVRFTGLLRKFTVLLLARSLLRGPQAVSPLANVVRSYYVADFTREDLRAFLERCERITGVGFTQEAFDYLYGKAAGQAVLLQRILKVATSRKYAPAKIGLEDILGAVCDCPEEAGGAVDRLLDVWSLTDEAQLRLSTVLQGISLPAFGSDPAIAQLLDLGIVRSNAKNRCDCRSPLVRELLSSTPSQ